MLVDVLMGLLDGSEFATCIRDTGKPAPFKLPADPAERRALVEAHIAGTPAELDFVAGRNSWRERVAAVVLGCYCPGPGGWCHWLGWDLDGAGHGPNGLADPLAAARALAERVHHAGHGEGLLVARSKSGEGVHVWLRLRKPLHLADASISSALLTMAAYRVANDDVLDGGGPHAFRTASGQIAEPGVAGGVELYPRATDPPRYGWALTLPGAGAYRARGGGVVIDVFTGLPVEPADVAGADATRTVAEGRAELGRRRARKAVSRPAAPRKAAGQGGRPSARSERFLAGLATPGERNGEAFACAANLHALGWPVELVREAVLRGAELCGLPAAEARTCVASALRGRS